MSSHTFRLKFADDQVIRYTLTSRSSQKASQDGNPVGAETTGGFEADLEQKIIRALADGSAHVLTITTPKAGPGIPEGARSVIYQHLGARGEVFEVSGPNQGNAFSFPEQAVGVGATWEGETQTQLHDVPEPVIMKYTYTFDREEELKGHACARITFTSEPVEFTVPMPDGKNTSQVKTASDGVMWFDVSKGLLVRLELTTRTQPKVGPVSFDIENKTVQDLVA